jgi:hypothetical protein
MTEDERALLLHLAKGSDLRTTDKATIDGLVAKIEARAARDAQDDAPVPTVKGAAGAAAGEPGPTRTNPARAP